MTKDEGSDSMRMWGALLRYLRIAAGITYEALADYVGYSKSLVVGIERGTRMPSEVFIAKSDECLQAGGLLIEAAKHLSRQRFLSWFEEYAEEEQQARILWTYDTHVLHDLLQTEAYARAVLAARRPAMADEVIEAHVETRLNRRSLLTRQPACALSFIIEERVLHRCVGGPPTAKGQLEHLIHLSEQRNVTLQVMPTACEAHAGIDGPMTLVQTSRHTWLAHLETHHTSHFITDAYEVSALHERHTTIRSHALTPSDSARLIERLL